MESVVYVQICTNINNHILSIIFWKNYNSSRCYTKQLKCFSVTTAWHALVNDLLWESIIHALFLPGLLRSTLTDLLWFLSFSSLMLFVVHHSQFMAFNSITPHLSDLLLWKTRLQLMMCGTPPRVYMYKREEVILLFLKSHLPHTSASGTFSALAEPASLLSAWYTSMQQIFVEGTDYLISVCTYKWIFLYIRFMHMSGHLFP